MFPGCDNALVHEIDQNSNECLQADVHFRTLVSCFFAEKFTSAWLAQSVERRTSGGRGSSPRPDQHLVS